MDPIAYEQSRAITRRHFLSRCNSGVGAIALAQLLGQTVTAESDEPLAGAVSAIAPKAKRVIYLHMAGSPPVLDMFDYKPELKKHNMQPCPKEFFEGKQLAFTKGHPNLLGSPYDFHQHGQTCTPLCELFEHFGSVIDDVALVKSMYTDQFNHAPAQLLLYTGSANFGAASMGAWTTYGIGSENQNLPGYVVLLSGGSDPSGGKTLWGSGFLPSVYQGVQCRSVGEPILYVNNPKGMTRQVRRRSLNALKRLNELELQEFGDPETLSRINQFELAYRMQIAVPEVMDINNEPESIRSLYGAEPGKASFANNCLLARRLVEQGTRYVQLFDYGWDIHGTGPGDDLINRFPQKMRDVDRPMTALIKDLKQSGLLDETLVVWGGEFGRTSMNEARGGSKYLGRDHHPGCFTIWMAGGGIKPGVRYGATDPLGYNVVENKMHVHDLQATILHLLGLDPHRLNYPFQGLNQRLIGPADGPKVHHGLIA